MKRFFALCALALSLGCAAQISGLSRATDTQEVTTPQVRARVMAYAPHGVQVGQPLWLGLQLTHQPEWHTYWRNPGDSGLPTQLDWELPSGLHVQETLWPLPRKLKAGPLTNYGYDGTALLVTPVIVQPEWQATSTVAIRLRANWLVCRLECIPQEGEFSLQLPTHTSAAADAAAFETVLRQQASPLPSAVPVRFEGPHLALSVSGLPAHWQGERIAVFPEQPELLESAAEQHPLALQRWQGDVLQLRLPQNSLRTQLPTSFGLVLIHGDSGTLQALRLKATVDGAWPAAPDLRALPTSAEAPAGWGWLLALLGAFVGGLILNLMPCVLPVLALKVMAFTTHRHAHRAHRVAGLAYTAGVLISFLALGGAVLALRAAGEQLGWGFQLQSPWVVAGLALLFTAIALNLLGLLEIGQLVPSALLSLQARHPVLDALLSGVLAVAVASPCTAPFMGASLGVAVTLPPAQALSIFASMGVGLALPYALASWFPGVAERLPRPGPWMVTLRRILALPMLATVVWLLWVLAQQLGATPNTDSEQDGWAAWSENAVAQAQAEGQPVFVDFTAAWCVTCQINKQTTLADPSVREALARHHVRLLRADWTRRDTAITAALTQLGRSGVPVYVLYAPGQAPQVLSELLTPSQIHDALARLPRPND